MKDPVDFLRQKLSAMTHDERLDKVQSLVESSGYELNASEKATLAAWIDANKRMKGSTTLAEVSDEVLATNGNGHTKCCNDDCRV